jgi:hypothetical protein
VDASEQQPSTVVGSMSWDATSSPSLAIDTICAETVARFAEIRPVPFEETAVRLAEIRPLPPPRIAEGSYRAKPPPPKQLPRPHPIIRCHQHPPPLGRRRRRRSQHPL